MCLFRDSITRKKEKKGFNDSNDNRRVCYPLPKAYSGKPKTHDGDPLINDVLTQCN